MSLANRIEVDGRVVYTRFSRYGRHAHHQPLDFFFGAAEPLGVLGVLEGARDFRRATALVPYSPCQGTRRVGGRVELSNAFAWPARNCANCG